MQPLCTLKCTSTGFMKKVSAPLVSLSMDYKKLLKKFSFGGLCPTCSISWMNRDQLNNKTDMLRLKSVGDKGDFSTSSHHSSMPIVACDWHCEPPVSPGTVAKQWSDMDEVCDGRSDWSWDLASSWVCGFFPRTGVILEANVVLASDRTADEL